MRLTIIVDDSAVCIDGVNYTVDLSEIEQGVHAVQWYDTWGDVEWKDERGRMVRNEEIDSIERYQWAIDLWTVKDNEFKAAQAAAQAALLAAQQQSANT